MLLSACRDDDITAALECRMTLRSNRCVAYLPIDGLELHCSSLFAVDGLSETVVNYSTFDKHVCLSELVCLLLRVSSLSVRPSVRLSMDFSV